MSAGGETFGPILHFGVRARFRSSAPFASGCQRAHGSWLVSLGDCKATYTLEGDKNPIEKSYLFRSTDKGWLLDRELGKNEKVNYKKGIVENSTK